MSSILPLQKVMRKQMAFGGISAIAISQSHYYSCRVECSGAFGGVLIYLNEADLRWGMRPDDHIVFWEGETKSLRKGLTLVDCDGKLDGSSVLLWPNGAAGRGALLTADTVRVAVDRRHVSLMSNNSPSFRCPPKPFGRLSRRSSCSSTIGFTALSRDL